MLLRHSLALPREALLIERAVTSVIAAGARTADMGPAPGEALSTSAMGERIRHEIAGAHAQA
jgi:isocitrate/isopropylmalate dehydrogenase